MPLLTDGDRKFILDQLKNAPDSVLADAMLAFNAIRDKLMQIRKMTTPDNAPPLQEVAATVGAVLKQEVEKVVDRPNVSPGVPAITKIGSESKINILHNLKNGIQPGAKYAEHAKLLWSRGEVKFDGEAYYL